MGFRNIDIVDLDTVDYSNLNRQFLFRKSDVGKPKAAAAAEFIKRRFPDANITPHCCDLKTLSRDFYSQFDCVLLGLDSIEVRNWTNSMICSLIEYDEDGNPTKAIPIINGGSEVFMVFSLSFSFFLSFFSLKTKQLFSKQWLIFLSSFFHSFLFIYMRMSLFFCFNAIRFKHHLFKKK